MIKAFARDHERIAQLFDRAFRELAAGRGGAEISAIVARLRMHLDLEEEVVLPAVERAVEDPRFVLPAAMRREHAVLRELLVEIDAEASKGGHAGVEGNLRELEAALRVHHAKEEKVFYPLAERELAARDMARLGALLDADRD